MTPEQMEREAHRWAAGYIVDTEIGLDAIREGWDSSLMTWAKSRAWAELYFGRKLPKTAKVKWRPSAEQVAQMRLLCGLVGRSRTAHYYRDIADGRLEEVDA